MQGPLGDADRPCHAFKSEYVPLTADDAQYEKSRADQALCIPPRYARGIA